MREWIALDDYRLLPAVSGIYVIRNRESLLMYVGQSKNIRKRMVSHRGADSTSASGRWAPRRIWVAWNRL